MTTTPVQETTTMPGIGEHFGYYGPEGKGYYTREEFMNELAHQLGSIYGLNDIREAV